MPTQVRPPRSSSRPQRRPRARRRGRCLPARRASGSAPSRSSSLPTTVRCPLLDGVRALFVVMCLSLCCAAPAAPQPSCAARTPVHLVAAAHVPGGLAPPLSCSSSAGVVDGDAYYINQVVVGEVPKVRRRWLPVLPTLRCILLSLRCQRAEAADHRSVPAAPFIRSFCVRTQVGDRVSVDAVAHQEGSYRWRVTRLQLESEALAAAAKAAAAMAAQQQRGPSRYGQRTGAPAGCCLDAWLGPGTCRTAACTAHATQLPANADVQPCRCTLLQACSAAHPCACT